jgi:hypothetical protein
MENNMVKGHLNGRVKNILDHGLMEYKTDWGHIIISRE